jgi:hypothetical protein
MSSLRQDVGVSWRSDAGQWASGTLKALATIAVSALLVFIVVSVFIDTGLLTASEPVHRSPAVVSPSGEVAFG